MRITHWDTETKSREISPGEIILEEYSAPNPHRNLHAKIGTLDTLCNCVMSTWKIIGFCTSVTLKDTILTRITYFQKE